MGRLGSRMEVLATERRLGGILTMLIISLTWTDSNLHTTRNT